MSGRKMTPRGQMTRGANSGPAVMMMPPHIRATFMPNPPLKSIPPHKEKRKHALTGVMDYLAHFERTAPKPRTVQPTPQSEKQDCAKRKQKEHDERLAPLIDEYRKEQKDCGGEYHGMNCYNTLFVGRLAYEVTDRKLLREMEAFGPVKDIKLVVDDEGRSKGYAFVEYENEEDMKRAYRAADGMKIEGREIVADVERGHTVPTWLPRRLGGGLGGTRLGGKDMNVTTPGRFDPNRPEPRPMPPVGMGPPPPAMGRGQGPPMPYGGGYDDRRGGGGFPGYRDGPPMPPPYGMGGPGPYGDRGPPPPSSSSSRGGSRYGDSRKRQRSRSRSPDRRRPRY